MDHIRIGEKVAKLLAQRDYSEYELRKKLSFSSYLQDDVDFILEKLHNSKLIDDIELGTRLFEKYRDKNKYSLKMILNKLKQRGFSRNVIAQILNNNSSYDEYSVALRVSRHYLKNKKDSSKLTAYLYSKGFSSDIIGKVIQEYYVSE